MRLSRCCCMPQQKVIERGKGSKDESRAGQGRTRGLSSLAVVKSAARALLLATKDDATIIGVKEMSVLWRRVRRRKASWATPKAAAVRGEAW